MISYNSITLVGHVGGDPESKGTDGNIVSFSVATKRSWKDRSGERQENVQWHKVVIFADQVAKFARDYIRKGDMVLVVGEVEYRKWEKGGGEIVNITEVIVRPFTGQVQLQSKNRDDADRPAADHERRSEREASRSSRASSKPSGRSIADDDEIPF